MTHKAQRRAEDQSKRRRPATPNAHSSRFRRASGRAAGVKDGITVCMAGMCLILRQLATPAQRRNHTPENARHAP